MLLRTRIMVFVGTAVVAAAGAVGLLGNAYRDLVTDQVADQLTDAEAALVEQALETADARLGAVAERLVADPELISALATADDATIALQARRAWQSQSLMQAAPRVDLVDEGGQVIFTSADTPLPRALIDGWPLRDVLERGTPVGGSRTDEIGTPMIAHAQPIALDGNTVGAVILAHPVAALLDDLASREDRSVFLLAADGVRLAGVPEAQWVAVSDQLVTGPGLPPRQTVHLDDRAYDVAIQVVPRLGGGLTGYLATVRDITVAADRRAVFAWGWTLAVALVIVAVLALVGRSLYAAFAPLDEAIDVLDGLSRGETWRGVEPTERQDEIGRIARSVGVFRNNALVIERQKTAAERRQRRQRRFIRSQLLTLADTLDKDARPAMLAELAELERPPSAADATANRPGTADELGALAVGFGRMAGRVAEQHRRLTELVAELREALSHKRRLIALEHELDIASKIQSSVLPRAFPEHPGMDVFGRMIPAREVGGDFYDFFQIDDHRFGVTIADVSGKGVPAAFFMLIARTLLKATASFGLPAGACLARLNDLLSTDNDQMMFVTAIYGLLDLRDRTFTYANGGHNPPVLLRNGSAELLAPSGDMALAVMPDQSYRENRIDLAPEATLVLYTDGVTEAFDPNDVEFGEERLTRVLRGTNGHAAREVVETVVSAVLDHAGDAPQADDITCLAVSVNAADTNAVTIQ